MKFLFLKESLKKFPVFSIHDIKKIDPDFDSKLLVYWQKKGYLKKIINRWYCFTDTEINEAFLFLIANSIYSPSYISFETALSYYQLIPEGVYAITSATSLKTNAFKTDIGFFSYHHLKPSLFFGYHLIEAGNHRLKMADIEKTILDYFYINEKINSKEAFDELRINKDVLLSQLNTKTMNAYLKIYSNKALEKRVNNFIQYVKHA